MESGYCDYAELTEEALIERARGGESGCVDYLMEKYKPLVRQKARTLFLVGGDKDDLIQEGMIGLYKAVRDYQGKKDASFATFANLCITRQLYSAIRISNRMKNSPLNNYVALSEQTWTETGASPEELFLDKEKTSRIEDALQEALSPFEKEVMQLYIQEQDYRSIAQTLGKEPKAVDNALQRIKTKLRKILEQFEN